MTTYNKEDIIYVTAQPDVPYFHWQVELYVHNFISLGIDPKQIHVIFSLPNGAKERTETSKRLDALGCNIHFYQDARNEKHYIPSIKPYLVSRWIKDYPELGKLIFLHDADIIFREIPNFDVLLNDEISYLSDTVNYIGYDYIKHCCDRYETQHPTSENLQLLKEMCDVVGISIDIVKENQSNSGGGQYLLKNTTYELWNKIYLDCTPLYNQMLNYQVRFPINGGQIQFWTAEMWAMLWNIWKFGIQTKVTNELEFSWATDNIYRYEQTPILHMAGVTDDLKGFKFYKGEYIDVNPIEKLRENPNHFDYIDQTSSTIKYIEVMKNFIKNTNKNMENKFIYNNQIDITIIGEKDQSDGLGQTPIFIIELLKKNNINYNFHQSHKNYDISYKKTNFNNFEIKEIGKILINTGFPNEIPPSVGNLNFIYTMYESDKIHDTWVDNINLFYDGVLVPDEWVSEVYKNSGVIKPIYVIPHIILNNKIEIIKTKKHEFIFGLNAQYELRKNHEQVIESFVQIWGNNDKYKLKIHGKHKTHIYENLIKKYKNFENVEITTGILNESELSDWYSDLDCYILASKGEGFSLTPRETILSEIPSILSNYSAHKTLVDTGGILPIDPSGIEPAYKFGLFNDFVGHHATFDTEDIKKSMVSMVSNYEFYREKVKITKNWILENENIESISNKFLNFLEDQKEKITHLNNNIFNIKDVINFGEFNHHNWNYTNYYLSKIQNNPNSNIFFDTFLDHSVLGNNPILYSKLPYQQKWAGFIHHTWCPDIFINSSVINYTLDFTFSNIKFIESIKNCVGLITFSDFYRNEITNYFAKNNIDCSVYSLKLPIINTRKYFFNLEEFKKNKKILFSGSHMRKFETLQLLDTKYEKFYIGSSDEIIKSYFKIIGLEFDERIQILPKVDDYLKFFTNHLLILDFTDTNANNSLNECIITQNPVLVRKLPSLVEYLGEDYPLYFESIEEANRKINDLDLIESAHNYLKDNYGKLCYNISYEKFNEDFNKISKEIFDADIINMKIPKISIITSLKNAKEYLPQFIDDVTRQTIFEKNCEWIIIDANDNDDDYKILQPYLNQYPNIIYQRIEKDNGIYSCWNEAIKRSTGDFITNMNCDDRRSPDNLEKMAKLLHENEDVSLVYCDSYIVHQSNINWELLPQNCERYNFPEFENSNMLYENPPHSNPMWRRKLHIKYGFFDEKYKSAGDWDFWLRCWYNGEKFKKHPEVLGIYYWNPIGISTNTKNRINFVENEQQEIFNKFNSQLDKNKRTDLSICFLTSLSPSHKNYESQVKAIDSWKRFGKIYSINSKSEISHLKKMFPEVNFVLNDRDNESLADYGRPYTYISSFFNLARGLSFDYFCIINSDIIIDGSNDKWEKYLFNLDEESLTVSQRFNFNDTFDDGVIEYWGYDVFTINRKLVDKFPYHTNFLMGQPWWDWWIQIYCMKHRIPVIINNSSIFYHKLHPIQWSQINYEKFAREFSDEFGLDKEPITSSERIEFILNEIKNYGYLIDDNEEREIFNKFNVQLESNQEKRNKKLKIKVTAQIKGFSGYNSASRNIIDQLLDLDFIDLYIDEIDPYENEKCDRISNIDFNKYDRFKVDYDYYDFNIVIYPPTENLICKKSLKNCFLFFWEMYSMYEYHYKVLNDNPELIVMSTSNFLNEIIKHNKLKNKFYKISHVHKRVKKITNKNHKVRYYSICQDVPRKNIKQTIDCFLETFKYVEDVEYNIKISKFNRDLSYWYEYLKKTDKINLITDFLTDDQIDNFHRENDIFYLCQHSEGYGIPHLDALNYGNEVVTNDFGALKDHLNDGNSYLIPYKVDFADFLELHDRDCYFYNLNTKWAVFNNQDIKHTLFNSYMNFKRGIRKNKSLNLEKNNNDILYFLENETTVTNFKNPDFVIVSHDKINNSHGTGIYLSNLTKFDKNFLTISSVHLNSYFEINSHDNNDILDIRINYNDFKHIDISLNDESIKEYFNEKVKNINTKKILSVPYFVDDVINTILLKNKTGAKLVTYIMDDQNIIHNNIPDDLMRELLEKSDLRLCISKDMCREYNKKYGLDFYFLPPLVKKESIKKEYTFTHEEWVNTIQKNPGVMVGNIWNPKWLDELSKLTKNLNIQINWFSPQKINNDKIIELRECGINYLGHIPEPELLDILNSSPFGLILTSLNEDDERKDLTFSLSSKLTYMMSAAGLPIISVGDKKTINSKFVKEMNIGLNSEYTINELQDCINEIMNFSSQEKFRKNSYYIGNQLNIDYHCQSKNLEQTSINWIWESCEIGKPINSKYENLDKTLKNSKVIVSSFEINNLHGTGPLIKRVVGGEDNTLVILSKLQYDFKNDFGDVVLHIDSSKIERRAIIDRLGKNEMEQILCVPYLKEDLITSITLHNEFNVPMGCYIMDDQNIVYNNIPDDLMFEFLSKCSVRFVTHPELRDAYENKFKLKFYIIPQIVPDELINKEEYDCEKNSNGAIIGSIWSYNWLKKLCQTLKESNVKVDWYGNNKYPWLIETDEELISYGLNPIGLLSEEELSKKLKSYPYVIVPYGTLEDDDDAKNLTKLSLPGRIIFASATANIPIIVMGSEQCSAAQFVTKFGIGTVCDYNGNSLIEAINFVKENEKELRKNAFLVANNFSSKGIEEFLWQSIKSDVKPFDLRFENIFNDKY